MLREVELYFALVMANVLQQEGQDAATIEVGVGVDGMDA